MQNLPEIFYLLVAIIWIGFPDLKTVSADAIGTFLQITATQQSKGDFTDRDYEITSAFFLGHNYKVLTEQYFCTSK